MSGGHPQCLLALGHEGKHKYRGEPSPFPMSERCPETQGDFLGHAVENGRIRFLSVSQLERADPRSGGCLRKWAYRYVFGIKDREVETDGQREAKDKGTMLHAEIEAYLRTGVKALSPLALAGLHMIPEPGPDLSIEFEDNRIDASAPLKAAGIPVIIKMDLVHRRGTNKGASEIDQIYDPPGTIEVMDWKRKGKEKAADGASTILHPNELVHSVQMAGYGTYIGNVVADANYERLSHGYFIDSPRSGRKVTKLVVVDDCRRTWEYVEGVARRMVHAAAEKYADSIDANIHACDRYGGCGHRKHCTAYRQNATADIFDEREPDQMSLLQTVNQGAAQFVAPAAPAQQPAPQGYGYAAPAIATQAPPAPPPAQPQQAPQVTLSLLEQQEAEARMRQAAQPIPGFQDAMAYLQIKAGRGLPPLGGRAAMMAAALGGQSIAPGTAYQGVGDLGRLPVIEDPAHIIALAQEVSDAAAKAAAVQVQAQAPQVAAPAPQVIMTAAAPQALPPQMMPAPQALNPAPGMVPVASQSTGPAPVVNVHVQHAQAPAAVLPPEAPASNPAIASKPVDQVPAQQSGPPPLAPAPAPKKRAANKKKAAAAGPEGAPPETILPAEALVVFVDCLPNCEFDTLTDYQDTMLRALEGRWCTSGIADVRCAPKDGPLGYGGWRGAIAAFVRTNPPPAGVYMLDTRGSDVAAELADALRSACEPNPGSYVRGIR